MTYIEYIKPLQQSLNLEILTDEPLAKHTSFRIGGPAEIFARPKTKEEFCSLWDVCLQHQIPITILGDGTNVLISDSGLKGVVVVTNKMNSITIGNAVRNTRTLIALAGARLSKLAETACNAGLSGLEFASGIPGTVGGAVYMNAGAYGNEIKDVCAGVTMLLDNNLAQKYERTLFDPVFNLKKGYVKLIPPSVLEFDYRKSIVQQGGMFILEAIFLLQKSNTQEIREKMNELNNRRRTTQPLDFPSAGSTFKRPEGFFAGKLIQDSGLRGFSIGGAQVSEKHTGFIINKGGATANDVIALIRAVREKVHADSGIWLEPEVQMFGDDLCV